MRLLILGALAAAALACSGEEAPDGGTAGSGGTSGHGGSGPPASTFELTVIDEGQSVGFQPEIARAPDGELGVAYLRRAGETGSCDHLGTPTPVTRWEIVYAGDDTSWDPQVVATSDVFAMLGLGLAFDAGGEPAILYQGGMDSFSECGGTDALLARRSGGAWQTTIVDTDGNAPPYFPEDQRACADYQDTCNVGGADGVVGQWPALVFSGGQPFAAYRDTHFGFAQDDSEKADLETSWTSGLQTLDATYGGGLYTRAALDGEGNPLLVHYNPFGAAGGSDYPAVASGLWVIRWDGTKWIKGDANGAPAVKLRASEQIGVRLGFGVSGSRAAIAWRDDAGHRLRYVESRDLGQTWAAPETPDQKDDTGMLPALAFDPAGNPAIAYYRCGRYNPDVSSCKPGEDALRIAVKTASGWNSRTVSERGSFTEATGIGLAFDGSGNAVIAFQAQTFDPESGAAVRQLVLAREVRE